MMDLFEKKIKELFQEKRKLDEKSIPAFNTFLDKPGMTKPVNHLRIFYIRAVSVAAITIFVVFLFYYFNTSSKTQQEVHKITPVNINQPLPSQSLLNPANGAAFIWQWKSPTDKLLHDVHESTTRWKNKKI